ncbi:C-type lectin BpLec-like [Calonectris borealis]|uniref:C-type lectin BpLec-like n=1 Tax=Calonectris borealis TaxID=1323832 RepID=UPI003F4C40FF
MSADSHEDVLALPGQPQPHGPQRPSLTFPSACPAPGSAEEMGASRQLRPRLLGCLLLLTLLGGALASSPSCAPARRPAASCPQNWYSYRGYCYGYFTERRSWAQAENECKRYGPMGRLASIHSLGASRVLASYVSSQRDGTNTWIGLQDEEHTRQWKWSDNSAFDYKRWAAGQPNNLWDKEDCVVLDKLSGFEFWHDYPCDSTFPFLCQHQL